MKLSREEKDPKKKKKLDEKRHKANIDLNHYMHTSEWNVNTTLKAYIDPRVVVRACKQMEVPVEKMYSKTLVKKFSWAIK